MTITNITYAQSPQKQLTAPRRKIGLIEGTATASVAGAGAGFMISTLGGPVFSTKSLIKGGYTIEQAKEIIKSNRKVAGIAALIGAVVIGGAYLAYRGIKSLISKPDDKVYSKN